MLNELETILWNFMDEKIELAECLKQLPTSENVTNDEISVMLGFAGMTMSISLLRAFIDRYQLSAREFNTQTKYMGKTPREWIKMSEMDDITVRADMLAMIENVPSFKFYKSSPSSTPNNCSYNNQPSLKQ